MMKLKRIQSKNKKILNAEECTFNDKKFKSKLERSAYMVFRSLGIDVEYELEPYVLLEGWCPKVKTIIHGDDNKTKKGSNKKIMDWKYTPDFVFTKNDKKYFVEMKGFGNDTLPLKRKMFIKYLENNFDPDTVEYWEVYSITELRKLLSEI